MIYESRARNAEHQTGMRSVQQHEGHGKATRGAWGTDTRGVRKRHAEFGVLFR